MLPKKAKEKARLAENLTLDYAAYSTTAQKQTCSLQSLAAELYKDGRRVSQHEDHLIDAFQGVTAEDKESGYRTVLRSLSERQDISSIKNLYKIGYSRGPVEERIKNAPQQPTYLMAPVAIVSVFQCYNLNPHKFETLIHHFFGSACLSVDVIDDGIGRRCIPENGSSPLSM